jgi:hypothetical protein
MEAEMRTKLKPFVVVLLVLVVGNLGMFGCASAPKATVELSEITEEQVAELQKSHIRFVELYYNKLRDDVNEFIDKKWMPLFLAKAVENPVFRKDLDEAYVVSSIEPSDVDITWKGRPLGARREKAVLRGVENAIWYERSQLGHTLLDFSEEVQRQINNKRLELLKPIDAQERMVINQINVAYADLRGAQASIKAYLTSIAELKEKQDLVLEKLGALKRSEELVSSAVEASETLSVILQETSNAEEAVNAFLQQIKEAENRINAGISAMESALTPTSNE